VIGLREDAGDVAAGWAFIPNQSGSFPTGSIVTTSSIGAFLQRGQAMAPLFLGSGSDTTHAIPATFNRGQRITK